VVDVRDPRTVVVDVDVRLDRFGLNARRDALLDFDRPVHRRATVRRGVAVRRGVGEQVLVVAGRVMLERRLQVVDVHHLGDVVDHATVRQHVPRPVHREVRLVVGRADDDVALLAGQGDCLAARPLRRVLVADDPADGRIRGNPDALACGGRGQSGTVASGRAESAAACGGIGDGRLCSRCRNGCRIGACRDQGRRHCDDQAEDDEPHAVHGVTPESFAVTV